MRARRVKFLLPAVLPAVILAAAGTTPAAVAAAPPVAGGLSASAPATAGLRATATPTVTDVRVGRHAAYDRVVIQFTGALPKPDVRFVKGIAHSGSGQPVRVDGAAILQVRFRGARAHDEDGKSTTVRQLRPKLAAVRHVRLAEDYEGDVVFGLGLSERLDYRITRLSAPNRLVIDVRHPLPAPTSTAKRTVKSSARAVARLVDVRTARHARFDRVVFQFRGSSAKTLPTIDAGYVRRVYQDGTGDPVTLAGKAALQLSLHPAAGYDDDLKPTWLGKRSVLPGLPAVRQVRNVGDWEAVMTFGLGVDEKAGFRVLKLANPARLVVDVAH